MTAPSLSAEKSEPLGLCFCTRGHCGCTASTVCASRKWRKASRKASQKAKVA